MWDRVVLVMVPRMIHITNYSCVSTEGGWAVSVHLLHEYQIFSLRQNPISQPVCEFFPAVLSVYSLQLIPKLPAEVWTAKARIELQRCSSTAVCGYRFPFTRMAVPHLSHENVSPFYLYTFSALRAGLIPTTGHPRVFISGTQ